MSYIKELKQKLKEVKILQTAISFELKKKNISHEQFDELIQKRNILSVQKMTIESRLKNIGRDVHLPNYYQVQTKN